MADVEIDSREESGLAVVFDEGILMMGGEGDFEVPEVDGLEGRLLVGEAVGEAAGRLVGVLHEETAILHSYFAILSKLFFRNQ